MFLEHGTFQAMELAVKKRNQKMNSQTKAGGWYTKGKLEKAESYSKTLILN